MRKTRSQTQAEATQSTNNRNPQPPMAHQNLQTQPENLTYQKPSDFEAVKNMIQFFRVYELQRLLLTLNLSHNGRKIELQNRLVDALQQNFNFIAPQIRDIYKSCGPENQQLASDLVAGSLHPPPEKRMYQPQLNMQSVQGAQPGMGMIGNNVILPFGQATISGNYPIHPDVRLKKLPFFDEMSVLIQPSTLVPQNAQNRLQEATFYFTLTPSQATDIASNRDIRAGSKIDHTVQVQLRFCLLETSCEQEDCFPPQVNVKVNNKVCQLPNPIPTNRQNVEPKRPPRPVNVTSNVKLSPTVTNNITVQWVPEFTRGYVIAVYLVRKIDSTQLLQRMKTKGIKPADYTRGLIKEKLTEDADCEIATTMLKVSLICPLGKIKMSMPCRASTCMHLQCFDASAFLLMNEKKPTWICPVCNKPATYEHLVIDGYFQEVLASPLVTSDHTEIQLHKDGSWSTHTMRNESQILDTPNKIVEKVEVISDDLEVITTEPELKPSAKAMQSNDCKTSNNNEPTSTTNNESTVDLTLSDSDDDLPLKRRVASSSNQQKSSNGQAKPTAVVNATKIKHDDSIISLDSPSPPPSPTNNSSNNVNSTTPSFCPLQPDPLDTADLFPSNFQINPLALNRQQLGDNTLVESGYTDAISRLLMNTANNNNLASNFSLPQNVVRPYREEDDRPI